MKNQLTEKNTKYVFIMLKIVNGEYEYESCLVYGIHKDKNIKKWAEDYASDFYGGKGEKEDGGYYFHGGAVHVSVKRVQNVNKEERAVLEKFLNV